MIIRRVHVRLFRKLVDQVLECGPGLNVIRGRNDAGKSTLHLAFSAAFFRLAPSEIQSYGPWGEERPGEITVEFEADGHVYGLHKDFRSRKVSLVCDDEMTWETPKEVERRIGEVLGLPSLSLFRATAHISQWELAAVQKEQQEIGTRLSRIMTGGDTDAGRVLETLDKYIRRMEVGLHHPARTPGPLKRDGDRIASLLAEQQRLAGEVAAIEQAAAQRDRLASRIAKLEAQVEDDAALLDANRRLHALDGQVTALSAGAERAKALVERIEKAAVELEAAEADPALAAAPPDADVLTHLQEAAMRVRMLASLPGIDDATRDGGRAGLTPSNSRIVSAGLALGALASAVLGAILLWGHEAPWGVGALVLAAALVAAAAVARGREQAAALEAEVRSRRQRDQQVQAEARRRQAREAAEEVGRLLAALRAPSVEEAIARHTRYLEAMRKRDLAKRVLDGLLGGRAREAVTEEYQRTLLDLAAARAQRDDPDLALRRVDAAAFQHLHVEAEKRKKELAQAQAELQRLEGRLSGRSPHEDLARVEEELEEIRARFALTQRQAEVLKLTREVLFEAHRHTIVPGKVKLEELASEYLRTLSGGTYDRLSVDEHTLTPRVWVGPPKEWADVAAREIGSGAVDQCYLALRLGLVDLLCTERRPPLFLDDPFLAYDEERQAAAMSLLQVLARDRQIFLFTCRGVYDPYADHLLVLGEVRASAPAP